MADSQPKDSFRFPRWANYVLPVLLVLGAMSVPFKMLMVGLIGAPTTLAVGYQPEQPIPYSHDLHVTQLGIDCRYCHNTVEDAAFAAIPPTSVCMNCHHGVRTDSIDLAPLRKSWATGEPVEWVKVHDLADYSYFNHSAHVNKGVSCWSCHGRVDRMDDKGVWQVKELSMGWCLSCHRDPAPNLRPLDQVYDLSWGYNMTDDQIAQLESLGVKDAGIKAGDALTDDQRRAIGDVLKDKYQIRSPKRMADCSLCHR